MPSQNDLLQAKQSLSVTLLRTGLRAGFPTTMGAVRVQDAIAMAGQNVHAVGIGRKVVAGQATQTQCVRVYVAQKLAQSLLPPIYRIPDTVNGIPTDVIESPPAFIQV